ncbi:MAG: hypothetical protein JJE49_06875, partial [Peptostreptococcaceae bacterium]|nr:hypothetical protein [Peptostreptococcaceae bacterium]
SATGYSILGRRSKGIPIKAEKPTTTTISRSMIVATGRFMAKLEIFIGLLLIL